MKRTTAIKIHHLRIILLVVFYSLFFCVELFHNFCANTLVSVNGKSHAVYHAAKNTKSGQVKAGFRLNKRFKPASAKFDYNYPTEILVYYSSQSYVGDYSGATLFNIHLRTRSLRAPPVV